MVVPKGKEFAVDVDPFPSCSEDAAEAGAAPMDIIEALKRNVRNASKYFLNKWLLGAEISLFIFSPVLKAENQPQCE